MKLILNNAEAEKYVKWAKNRLAMLTGLRKDLNLPMLTKRFVPAVGAMVEVTSAEWGDMIRITAGVAAGRIITSEVNGVGTSLRFYYIKKNKLIEFDEILGDSFGWTSSLNGKAVVYQDTVTHETSIVRRGRAPQIVMTAFPGLSTFLPPSFVIQKNNHTTDFFIADLRIFNQYPFMVSDNGSKVYVIAGGFLPKIFTVTQAQLDEESLPPAEWSTTTSYELTTGTDLPSFVTEFYASLAIEHATPPAGDLPMDDTVSGFDVLAKRFNSIPGSIPGDVYWMNLSSTFNPGTGSKVLRLKFMPVFDRSSGRVYLMSSMPFITAQVNDPITAQIVTTDVHVKLSLHELKNGLYEELYSTVVSNVSHMQLQEDIGGDVPYIFEGLNVEDMIGSATAGYEKMILSYMVPTGRMEPKLGRVVENRSFDTSILTANRTYMENDDVIFSDLPGDSITPDIHGSVSLHSVGRFGYLFRTNLTNYAPEYAWYTKPDAVSAFTRNDFNETPTDLFLSSDGNKLWTQTSAIVRYYHLGVQVFNVTTTVPTADATSFALYGEESPNGFHFLDVLKAWSYKREAFRARIFKNISQPTPGVYQWVMQEAVLQWQDDHFVVLKVFSDVPVDYPSMGRLTETDPSVIPPIQSLSDSELCQDEFLPDVI